MTWPPPLTVNCIREMLHKFDDGIGCDEIGRQATLWYQLMQYYLEHEEKVILQ